ncbi:MAG: hypothetical protein FWF78_02635 [Defluviitaleaceae bacterium]|nr:hypothetical protein [Defluviitaleaceae bacterium]
MIKILKQKSGISLIFVLAIMLVLLTVSVSAFTAAGLGMGAYAAQRDRNQLNMYASSMERTIRSAILSDDTFVYAILNALLTETNDMGAHVWRDEFAAFFIDSQLPPIDIALDDITITSDLPDVFALTIRGEGITPQIAPFRQGIDSMEILVSGRITLSLTTTHGGIEMVSETTYQFDQVGMGEASPGAALPPGGTPSGLQIHDFGRWDVIRHEVN